jgi:hypothetical protein
VWRFWILEKEKKEKKTAVVDHGTGLFKSQPDLSDLI